MKTENELLKRITARPDVFGRKPIVRDMRISVEFILSLLAQGVSHGEILEDYPGLEPEDIRACGAPIRRVTSLGYAYRRLTASNKCNCGVLALSSVSTG